MERKENMSMVAIEVSHINKFLTFLYMYIDRLIYILCINVKYYFNIYTSNLNASGTNTGYIHQILNTLMQLKEVEQKGSEQLYAIVKSVHSSIHVYDAQQIK